MLHPLRRGARGEDGGERKEKLERQGKVLAIIGCESLCGVVAEVKQMQENICVLIFFMHFHFCYNSNNGKDDGKNIDDYNDNEN